MLDVNGRVRAITRSVMLSFLNQPRLSMRIAEEPMEVHESTPRCAERAFMSVESVWSAS